MSVVVSVILVVGTYEAGILETLDYFWRERRGDLAVVASNGGRCVQGYL